VSNGRLIANLAIAIPIGVLLRVAVVGSLTAGQILTFAIVALVFASIFVGLARVVVMVLFRMNHREETS
jgi:NADH:ubiquinone oxidoreductase subunit K